jgi:hypothetical protein
MKAVMMRLRSGVTVMLRSLDNPIRTKMERRMKKKMRKKKTRRMKRRKKMDNSMVLKRTTMTRVKKVLKWRTLKETPWMSVSIDLQRRVRGSFFHGIERLFRWKKNRRILQKEVG